ncbi:MAG: YggS family pyridoxal phosphate-dependent enzyme [Muribaculaceae bacterium]|nr:YggS family pyridoxal phosphate-dependent enzyme [Muribaculaceae bacterium]
MSSRSNLTNLKTKQSKSRFETIADNLNRIKSSLPPSVQLVAVSKFHPADAVLEAYNAGQRVFGESRVAELLDKAQTLPANIAWHFIGHLQTNKVKQLVGHVALIESVDSQRLLDLIDDISLKKNVITDVLMQVHVAAEDTKFGWSPDELLDFFRSGAYKALHATRIRGLMGMATNTDDISRIDADFALLQALFVEIGTIANDLTEFNILSMGMSDDYPLAINHGASHIRIGSAIFGPRSL